MAAGAQQSGAGISPPPNPWARPRSRSTADSVAIAVTVTVVIAAAGWLGLVFTLFGIPFIGAQCHGCPSRTTPMATVLALGVANGTCDPTSTMPAALCSYSVPIVAAEGHWVTPNDLRLALEDANDSDVSGYLNSVTLENSSGCPIATWDPGTDHWGTVVSVTGCGAESLSAPLAPNEKFVLQPANWSSLSLSGRGYQFVVWPASDQLAGQVACLIP